MMKDSLFLLISNVLGRESGAGEGAPLMMVKDFCFCSFILTRGPHRLLH